MSRSSISAELGNAYLLLCLCHTSRFKQGMNIAPFHLVEIMERNPDTMKALFVPSEDTVVTFTKVMETFKVSWSAQQGSNRRRAEGRAYTYLKQWWMDLDGKHRNFDM